MVQKKTHGKREIVDQSPAIDLHALEWIVVTLAIVNRPLFSQGAFKLYAMICTSPIKRESRIREKHLLPGSERGPETSIN